MYREKKCTAKCRSIVAFSFFARLENFVYCTNKYLTIIRNINHHFLGNGWDNGLDLFVRSLLSAKNENATIDLNLAVRY